MNISQASSSKFLDLQKLLLSPTITIICDDTDAGDAISLALHLIRTLVTSKMVEPDEVLVLTTRLHASFPKSTPHIYPFISRDTKLSLSDCKPVDPHPHFDLTSLSSSTLSFNIMLKLICTAIEEAPATSKPRLIIIECLNALRFAFGVDPSAFVRTLTGLNLSVIACAPTACCIDENISDISTIADNVINLSDLRTGVAVDIDGLISVPKTSGQWILKCESRRYKITPSAFNISA